MIGIIHTSIAMATACLLGYIAYMYWYMPMHLAYRSLSATMMGSGRYSRSRPRPVAGRWTRA